MKRLGELLHCAKNRHDDDNEWWVETRQMVEEVCAELAIACRGTVLGPPMYDPRTGGVHLYIEVVGEMPSRPWMQRGRRYHVNLTEVGATPPPETLPGRPGR